jgi:branched-chain amino acid transport system permease protein
MIPRRGILAVLAVVVALFIVDLMVGGYPRYILTLWLIYSLSALGLNLVMGFGQLYSLGHGGFMLVGAYGTAVAMNHWGFPAPFAVAFAAAIAVIVGVFVGLPAIRLRHFSLAIVTFAFGITLFQLVKSFAYTGGPLGMFLNVAGLQAIWQGRLLWYAAAILALLGLAVSHSVTSSRTGRALRMIATNETVAQSFGIHLTFYKLTAFALAALLGALAGGMHALVTGIAAPDTYGPDLSILMFAAVMIGGQGRLFGPFLGAAFVVAIPELTQGAGALAQIIYAVLFIAVVTLLPEGLLYMLETGWRRASGRVVKAAVTGREGTPQ